MRARTSIRGELTSNAVEDATTRVAVVVRQVALFSCYLIDCRSKLAT